MLSQDKLCHVEVAMQVILQAILECHFEVQNGSIKAK